MRSLAWVALVLLPAGCGDDQAVAPGTSPTIIATPSEIVGAPETVTLEGTELSLRAELWRDFMPMSPPDGRPLAITVKVSTRDGTAMPRAVQADSAWVIFGDSAWVTPLRTTPAADSTSLEAGADGGPKWGPGITVDVVVKLSAPDEPRLLLGARDQPVVRTD